MARLHAPEAVDQHDLGHTQPVLVDEKVIDTVPSPRRRLRALYERRRAGSMRSGRAVSRDDALTFLGTVQILIRRAW